MGRKKPPLGAETPDGAAAPTAPQERLDDATLHDDGDELTEPARQRPSTERPTRPDRPRLELPKPR